MAGEHLSIILRVEGGIAFYTSQAGVGRSDFMGFYKPLGVEWVDGMRGIDPKANVSSQAL
jgi:hypothetical protein